jgi:fumarate hydratase subunit beta
MSAVWLTLPVDRKALKELSIGQWVNLSGPVFTGRDAALARVNDLLLDGKTPPVNLKDQLLYFVGPTPPAPGEVVGAAGPTTSRRMERFLPALVQAGVAAVMGKGPLSKGAVSELIRHGVIYLSAAGGAGAYYGSRVKGSTIVAYEELGPEAIYCLNVENFPAVVAVDLKGNDLFEEGPKPYRKGSEL